MLAAYLAYSARSYFDSTFINNAVHVSESDFGGALHVSGMHLKVKRCQFIGNNAKFGGGL